MRLPPVGLSLSTEKGVDGHEQHQQRGHAALGHDGERDADRGGQDQHSANLGGADPRGPADRRRSLTTARGVDRYPATMTFQPRVGATLIAAGNRVPRLIASCFKSHQWVTRPARAIANRLLPDDPTLVTVRSGRVEGIRLLILPRSEKFLWTGMHEPEVQEAIVDLLAPGMTFWDVGAHIGYFTLLASRVVGPSGTVHAFEPMPETFSRLRESIAANDAHNVVAHEMALSPTGGTASFHGGDLSVLWSLEPGGGPRSVTVQCQTLAEAFSLYGPPDLIKVDAEGSELDILASGRDGLEKHRVPVLLETATDRDVVISSEQLPFYEAKRVDGSHWLLTSRSGAPG